MTGPLDVQAELRDVCARRDIHRILCDYMRGLDRLMPELHRSVFHEDAFVDVGSFVGGADGFVEFAQALLGGMTSTQHVMGQARIDVAGDRAEGEVYFVAYHRFVEAAEEKDLFIAGRYVDVYENRGAGWKIAKRRLLVDWARTDAAAADFMKLQPTFNLGARGAADFSNRRDWP